MRTDRVDISAGVQPRRHERRHSREQSVSPLTGRIGHPHTVTIRPNAGPQTYAIRVPYAGIAILSRWLATGKVDGRSRRGRRDGKGIPHTGDGMAGNIADYEVVAGLGCCE